MTTQFKKGILELCILKVISNKEMYGFEIIDQLAKVLDVNDNTIYPILRRLTEQGQFTTYTKESNIGAPRKYYQITEKGIESLKNNLKEWEAFIINVNLILKRGNENE